MNLQGRDLSIGMQGDDVRLLHSELLQVGFSVDGEERFFSEANRRAVLSFRRRDALGASDEFEKLRVKLSDLEVDTLKSQARWPARAGGKEVMSLDTKLSQATPPSV
jgi:peptidoglycan hydrolase-like protein with peptidoglycan-binding domain